MTAANVHDSQLLGALLDANNVDDELWADSAYYAEIPQQSLFLMGFDSRIHERAYRNRPLSEEQKADNTERSKTRAHVEHVFGDGVMTMGGKAIRSIGLANAKVQLGLKNLTYNLKRYLFWEKLFWQEAQA